MRVAANKPLPLAITADWLLFDAPNYTSDLIYSIAGTAGWLVFYRVFVVVSGLSWVYTRWREHDLRNL